MKNNKKQILIIGIVAILVVVVGIYFLGGDKKLIQENNKELIEKKVEEVRNDRAEAAQKSGYPKMWREDNLPEYEDAQLIKIRELIKRDQITLESEKNIREVSEYYQKELKEKGFKAQNEIINDFVAILNFKNDKGTVTVQIASLKDSKKVKINLVYQK